MTEYRVKTPPNPYEIPVIAHGLAVNAGCLVFVDERTNPIRVFGPSAWETCRVAKEESK